MAETPDARIVVASSNLRDLGGLTTSDGHTVRTGQLFRSGHLCDLGDADRAIVKSLGLRTIVDLRRPAEADVKPHPDLPSVDVVGISVSSDDNEFAVVANAMLDPRAEPLGPDHITNYFRTLVTDHIDRYRPVFDLTTDPDRQPLLFNCTAGKDRTGVLAALILHCLGVPREAIVSEYLLSARQASLMALAGPLQASAKQRHGQVLSDDAVMMLLGVEATYIEAAFASIESQCGSVENYLAETGVDQRMIERLKHDLLSG